MIQGLAELTAKAALIMEIKSAIQLRKLTQQAAAGLESITIDRFAAWLTALGRDVEIIVKPASRSRLDVVKAAWPPTPPAPAAAKSPAPSA